MINLGLLITMFLAGIVFQSIIHGPSRMLIDAILGFLGGLITGFVGNFILLSFALGCLARIILGRYVMCIVLMIVYISAGFVVGYYIF